MTLCATHRRGEEGGAGGVDHVAEFVLPLHRVEKRILSLHTVPGTRDDEAGGGVLTDSVAGQLFEDEPVIGLVFIEGANDVVAVVIGVGALVIRLEASRVGVAHHVEPMPRPTLAIVRTGEQAIDETGDQRIV
jgi:hypothetical protein